MERKKCGVIVDGMKRDYESGTTYQRIAEDVQKDYPHQIVLAYVDGHRLQELRKTVESDCSIRFVTTAEKIGHETYKRSLCFLDRKSTRLNSSHPNPSRMPSSA